MRNLANISEIKNLNAVKGGTCGSRPRYCAPKPPTCGTPVTPTPPRNPPVGGKPA